MKMIKLFTLLISVSFAAAAGAQAAPILCGLASSSMGPNDTFYINDDQVGSVITISGENYRIVSSQPGYVDDIYGVTLDLQSVLHPQASEEIFCH